MLPIVQISLAAVTAVLLVLVPAAAPADDAPDKPAEMKVLEMFAGNWDSTATLKPAVWTPQETRVTATIAVAPVLDGQFVMETGSDDLGGRHMSLRTFDPESQTFRGWYFHSQGFWNKSGGRWDDASQTLTWNGETETGIPFVTSVHLTSPDAADWSVLVKDKEGKVYFDEQGRLARRTDGNAVAAESVDQPAADPAELKVLAKRIGTWSAETTARPAVWTPAGGTTSAVETIKWTLGGRYMLGEAESPQNKQSTLWVATYDHDLEAFRFWSFHSNGSVSLALGKWNEAASNIVWSGSGPHEAVSTATWHFDSDDLLTWNGLFKNRDGQVVLDLEGTVTRRKK